MSPLRPLLLQERRQSGHPRISHSCQERTFTPPESGASSPRRGESVPGYEASSFFGLGAPKNTPAEVIDKLNKEIDAGLADPKIKVRLADLDGTVLAARRPISESSSRRKPRSGAR
jgi:hypothetical protein